MWYSFPKEEQEMKYLTKEYLMKKKQLDCLNGYEPVDDSLSFEGLYQKKLHERLLQAEKLFNTPIQMKETREEVIRNFDEKKYPKYDLVARRIVGYQSLDEALKAYDHQVAKQKLLFENRGPFDSQHATKIFESQYEEELTKSRSDIPFLFRKEIDPRFLALGCIPNHIFGKIQDYLDKTKEEVSQLEKEAEASSKPIVLSLPDCFMDFRNEKLPIVCLYMDEDDLVFVFHFEGLRKKNATGFSSFTFHDVSAVCHDDIPIHDSFDRNHMERYTLQAVEMRMSDDSYWLSMLLDNDTIEEVSFLFKDISCNTNF